jgi:hypothetical protein
MYIIALKAPTGKWLFVTANREGSITVETNPRPSQIYLFEERGDALRFIWDAGEGFLKRYKFEIHIIRTSHKGLYRRFRK